MSLFHRCKWGEVYESKITNPLNPKLRFLLQKCERCGRRRLVSS